MKRKFTAAVLCALILGAFPISASAHSIDAFASTNDGRIMGDLDNDGSVTSTDALIALRISVGLTEETSEYNAFGDMDHDGSVTSTDALLILRKSVGLPIGDSTDISANVIGDWTYSPSDGVFTNVTLNKDGTGLISASNLQSTLFAAWRTEGSDVIVTVYGEDNVYTYTNDTLVSKSDPSVVYTRGTTEADISKLIPGDWTYSPSDGVFTNVTLNKDGTGLISASNLQSTLFAAWRTEGSDVIVTVYGEDNVYTYTNDTLVSKSDPSVVYTRGTTEAKTEEDISEKILGKWTYDDGTNYTNVTVNSNGTVNLNSTLYPIPVTGTWTVDGSTVTVTAIGQNDSYTYKNDTLVRVADPTVVFRRGTTKK